jgi:thiol-disulfide isomerase/thioredoxin
MSPTSKIVLLAIATGAIGLAAGFLASGGGRRLALGALATDAGQQMAARGAPAGVQRRSPALIGERRPALVLPDLDGHARNLDEFGARPILVNFLASWCSPCRRELPELDRFARSGSATGVQVVGIAVEAADPARALLADVPVSFPVLVAGDEGIGLMPGFGNSSGTLPYSVLIDADGKLVARKLGTFEAGSTDAWIADALGSD